MDTLYLLLRDEANLFVVSSQVSWCREISSINIHQCALECWLLTDGVVSGPGNLSNLNARTLRELFEKTYELTTSKWPLFDITNASIFKIYSLEFHKLRSTYNDAGSLNNIFYICMLACKKRRSKTVSIIFLQSAKSV